MCTALDGRHIVGKGDNGLVVAVIILHRNLSDGAAPLALHINDLRMDGCAALLIVKILDEGDDTALVVKHLDTLLSLSLVLKDNLNTRVKEGLLSHSGKESFVFKGRFLEDCGVGLESYIKTVSALGGANAGKGSCHSTSFKSFGVLLTVAAVFNLYPFGKGVYNRCTNTVQTAGNLVSLATELTARVEHGIYNLKGGKAKLLIHTRGDASSVVLYGYAAVAVEGNRDAVTLTRKRLVNGVVHYLVYKVVQTPDRGRADIHTRSFSDRLKSLKDLYLAIVITFYFVYFI